MGVTFKLIKLRKTPNAFSEKIMYTWFVLYIPLFIKTVCNTLYNYITFLPAYCHPAVSFLRAVRWFFPLRHFVLLRRVFIGESWLAQYNWTDASWCCRLQACGLLLVLRSETFFESTFDKFFTFCLFLYCAEGKNGGPRPRILSIFRSDGCLGGNGFQW